ncbi:MAG: RIP metalloprotease RseP [Erysipelotrichaceae bacterium]
MFDILLFILVLSVIILVHELGHFICAKFFGVYVIEFSLGFGPTLLKYQGKETKYSLRIIPFGGFVSMLGEENQESIAGVDVTRYLTGINRFKRIIIMLGGIIMNFALALVLLIGVSIANPIEVISPEATIRVVVENSPAALAGLQAGDEIVKLESVNGDVVEPSDFYDITRFLSLYSDNDTIIFTVDRANERLEIPITPQLIETDNKYFFGISNPDVTYRNLSFSESINAGVNVFVDSFKDIFLVFGMLFSGRGLENLSGPIGIYQVTSQAASYGVATFLQFIALISLNVGIFNALPIPIFDGGRVVILTIEAIINKPLSEKVINAAMMASVVLIIALLVFTTFNDLSRIFS